MTGKKNIGIIGLGTIATAVAEKLAEDGHRLTVSVRSQANSERLAARYANVTVAENQKVAHDCDILFLGTTAHVASKTLKAISFQEGQQIISLMADLSFEATAGLVAPATLSARMIPFPSIGTGGSPILTFGDEDLIQGLFGLTNPVLVLENEAELRSYLCAQAVLSPAVNMVREAAQWLRQNGASDSEAAEEFLRSLVGSSLMASRCEDLLTDLNTQGGYNQRLRQHMQDAGMGKHLREGLDHLLK